MRYFVKLAYNGTPFCGWQIQPNGLSVQEVLQRCFTLILRQPIDLTGCGRTDAGVHAKLFFAHFDTESCYTQDELTQIVYKVNKFLPREIVVYDVFSVTDTLHARFSAIERTYRYYLATTKNPFNYSYRYFFTSSLDVKIMNDAALYLVGNKDFTSFSKLHTQTNNNYCDLKTAFWKEDEEGLVFEITANRFLRNMVRAVVGTLLWVGSNKISIDEFKNILLQQDRCKAGFSVPAHALFLENIRYPIDNFSSDGGDII